MSDEFRIVPPFVRAEGKDVPPEQIQAALNSLAQQCTQALNLIISQGPQGPATGDLNGNYPSPSVIAVHATSGTLDGVTIGATTRSAASFTTLSANGATNFSAGGTLTGTFTGGAYTGATIDNTVIGGTTRAAGSFTTLSANGTTSLASVTATGSYSQSATQNFFQNSGGIVNRGNDRMFVGDATAGSGTAGTAPFDWLSTFQKGTGGLGFGVSEFSQAAILTNQNTNALIGLTVAAQTLNANQVRDFWGVGGYALNNSASFATNAWGIYGEAHRLTTQAGATYAAELDTRNITTLTVIDPYTPQPTQTVGLQVASGAGFTGTQADNSAAINIQNNNAKWNIGINIGATALTGDDGSTGQGVAIATAYGHAWQWYGASNVGTSRIICFAKTTAKAMSLQFDEGFSSVKNSNGVSALQVTNNNSGANFLLVNPANAGAAPQLAAAGSDANVTTYIVGKGTSGVTLGGFTDGSNASAGTVGEYVTNSATGVSLTSGTSANITSVSLTAGDWDVSGTISFVPAGTTVPSAFNCGASTTSATLGGLGTQTFLGASFPAGVAQGLAAPSQRISIASTTTVYLVGASTFTTSTMTANGFIRARRVR